MKVLILTADSNGAYPVPATKGGAVATLIEHLVNGNNQKKLCEMQVLSYFEEEAFELSKQYPNVEFLWVKVPVVIKCLDKCAFNFIRFMKKEEKAVSFKSPFSLLYYIWKARKHINRTKADKIILENNIPIALSLKNTAFNGEWYYHLHNVPRIDGKCRDVMNKTTKFLCVSKFVADQIESDNSVIGKIENNRIEVLYNCVDTLQFRPLKNDNRVLQLREKYGFSKEDRLLIFTGRLTAEKGADVLLKALTILPNNVKVLIVGSYHYNADVKSEFQNKLYELAEKLADRVVFTGYVQHKDLPYYYNMADLAILPSIWDEPAGLTNIEAMACGIPTITTNSGGIAEYVGESIVLERDDCLAYNIANQVKRLLDNENILRELSKYSRNLVVEKFDSSSYIDAFMNCITS